MSSQFFYNRPTFPAQLDMSHPLTRGLVGCWVLNENSPNSMRAWDSSLYKNNGAITGAKGYWQGRLFNSTSDQIACGTSATFDLTSTFGIFSWVQPTNGITGVRTIFSKTNDPTYSRGYIFGIGQAVDGELKFFETTAWVASGYVINDGNWHLVGVTYDSADYVFYNNGVAVKTVAGTAPPAATGDSSFIGQYGAANYWGGTIGGLLIYNRTPTAGDVKSLYLEPYAMFL